MLTLLSAILILISAILAVPTIIYSIEVLAGLGALPKPAMAAHALRPAVAVLVPAHNEEVEISATLEGIWRQLREGDRLLVVADNCDDRTAELAREAGAEVIERRDPERRGKGYALDAGIRHLAAAPLPIIILVDADCVVGPRAIERLAITAEATERPVQGLYLIKAPDGAPLRFKVAEFAFIVKNLLRPAGLHFLGLPCQLNGSGMAFPWHIIRNADLAHGHIVEDMKLGLDMAQAGHPPVFCETARITSQFPYSREGALSQRRRWEEGHLAMTKYAILSMFSPALLRNPAALALSLDLLVPPLTLLLLMLCGSFVLTAAFAAIGISPAALVLSTATIVIFALSSILAWWGLGRSVLPARSLGEIPGYIFSKLGLYARALFARKAPGWVRTDRKGPAN